MPRVLPLLLLVLLALAPGSAQATTGWAPPEDLDVSGGGGPYLLDVRAAADGQGRVVVARQDRETGGLHLHTRSAQGAWGRPQELPVATDHSHAQPRLAVNEAGDAAVAYLSCDGMTTDCSTLVAFRGRGDATFRRPLVLASATTSQHSGSAPAVALAPDGAVTVLRREATGSVQRLVPAPAEPTGLEAAHAPLALPADAFRHALTVRADGAAVLAWLEDVPGRSCRIARVATVSTAGALGAPADLLGDRAACTPDVHLDDEDPALAPLGTGVLAISGRSTSSAVGDGSDARAAAWAVELPATSDPVRTKLADTRAGLFAAVDDRRQLVTSPAGDVVFAGTDVDGLPAVHVRSPEGAWTSPSGMPRYNGGEFAPVLGPGGEATVAGTVAREGTASTNEVVVVHRPRGGGAWGGAEELSGGERLTFAVQPAASATAEPTVVWRDQDIVATGEGRVRASTRIGGAAPTAAFVFAPAAPTAGQEVTFTSTSTDDQGILATAWDLDDDGSFDDASGATATTTFEAAGTYTVEVRVTDATDRTATASREVVVAARPTDPATTTSPDETTPGTTSPGSGGAPPAPSAPPAPPAARLPFGFVVQQVVDTNGRRAMPAVVGRDQDAARAKVLRALVHADVVATGRRLAAAKLPKRPGGGRWVIGDVIAQSPAPGTSVASSTAAQAPVALTFWAGAPSDRERCDDLEKALKGDELQAALDQLRAAGCAKRPDLVLDPSRGAKAVEVKKAAGKDGSKLTVRVPTNPAELDITTWKTSGIIGSPNPGPAAEDFTLTAGQDNVMGVVLRDRAGRRLGGAKVRVDLHEVGGKDVERTVADGAFATTVRPERAGTIHVLSEWADGKGERIYGYASFRVVKRTASSFVTALGGTYVRRSTGRPAYVLGAAPRAASIGQFFAWVADALRSAGAQVAATAEGVLRTARANQLSAMQLERGGRPGGLAQVVRSSGGVWLVGPSGVVAAGGANVVAAGGANVVAAGGGNVIAAGGGNLISDNGLGVVAAGGGNLVTLPDGARVVAAGGANVVAAGGANVVAAGGANVVSAGGANVVSAGGGN